MTICTKIYRKVPGEISTIECSACGMHMAMGTVPLCCPACGMRFSEWRDESVEWSEEIAAANIEKRKREVNGSRE